jgi:hypothetical protein
MEYPTSLNYTASKSVIKYKRYNVRTSTTNSGGSGSTLRFRLPNGLINLSSFTLCFDLTVSGLDDNQATIDALNAQKTALQAELATLTAQLAQLTPGQAAHTAKQAEITAKNAEITAKNTEITTAEQRRNYSNVKIPLGHKLIKEIRTFVNNQQVNAKCGDYDLFYTALYKVTVGDSYIKSKASEHGYEMISNDDVFGPINPTSVDEGDTSKSVSYSISDFLGIFRSGSESIIDTSLWGHVDLEFTINEKYCLAQYVKGTGSNANIEMKVSNVEGFVDKIVEISPMYNKLVNMMLESRKEPLMFCYQNFLSQINSNGKAARLQCRSQCIDAVVCFPLHPNYLNITATYNPTNRINPPRYEFNSDRLTDRFDTTTTKNCSLQMTINNERFPDVPINNALHIGEITRRGLFGGSVYSQSLMYNSLFQDVDDLLRENFVWFQSLCGGEEGFVNKLLTGYDTRGETIDIIVDHDCIVSGGSLFIGALTTSCLSLDPVSKRMTVIE